LVQGVAAIVGGAIANQRRALDVHDGVLQSLVVAHYSLGTGDVNAAAEAIRAAHEEARALVEELLGDVTTNPLPHDLPRGVWDQIIAAIVRNAQRAGFSRSRAAA
jgi:hypothetical protein